ncbi:MAG TPA: exopolysaccharide biosynthesis protein, partial [Rhodanobacteraceae bacterium]
MTSPSATPRPTARTLLRAALDAQRGDDVTLDTLLIPLHSRAFGVLLLVLAIPNFIPVPIGIGGVMGVLVIVLGLEMLIGLEHPLVPARLRRKTMRRTRVEGFLARTDKVMGWLEHGCKPRLTVIATRPWSMVCGLALVIVGFLLSLPIPFTNYLFGVVLLAFAFALIERDGVLLLVLWVLTA